MKSNPDKTPRLTERELVDAKHGLTEPDRRDLAVTALYWYDEARKLALRVGDRVG